MPKYHEMARKLAQLHAGQNVRPPQAWWNKMMPKIEDQYPDRSLNDRHQILGGIWSNYPLRTKINIIKEYQIDDESVQSPESKEILGNRFG